MSERGPAGRKKIVLVPSILVALTAIFPAVFLVVLQGRSLGFVAGFLALLYGIFLVVMNYAALKQSLGGRSQNRDTEGSSER